jgi:hypothetical protein
MGEWFYLGGVRLIGRVIDAPAPQPPAASDERRLDGAFTIWESTFDTEARFHMISPAGTAASVGDTIYLPPGLIHRGFSTLKSHFVDRCELTTDAISCVDYTANLASLVGTQPQLFWMQAGALQDGNNVCYGFYWNAAWFQTNQ